ncbi:response regulator transcription factor [candidate division WWE3 bacterium]|nr:response regulator transcription factor [candidate division WWE3 bacterium]
METTQPIRKKVIILIEDDVSLRTLYLAVLLDAGFDVQVALEAELGLDLIKTINWDLLLLDIMLPVKDGISILKVMSDEHLKKGKIVMLTNINNENIIKDAFKYGADGYIIKSDVTPGSLVTEVRTFI